MSVIPRTETLGLLIKNDGMNDILEPLASLGFVFDVGLRRSTASTEAQSSNVSFIGLV